MENGEVPLLPLAVDLDAMQIQSLYPPNLLQEYSQFSNIDVEWINNFLFGPMKFTNDDNHLQNPSTPLLSVGVNNAIDQEAKNNNATHGSSVGAAGSRVVDNRKACRRSKKLVPPRVAFHTRSADDVLDDGYRWRKYGQKAVKNSNHPRSYYRCTHHTCNVKKQIQRLAMDSGVVVTTYEGKHNHPSEKLMETLAPLLKQLQLLTRF